MKGKEALQKSYETELESFNKKKKDKISNIEKQLFRIDEKLRGISEQRQLLEESLNEWKNKEFKSFDSFRSEALERSQKAKEKVSE